MNKPIINGEFDCVVEYEDSEYDMTISVDDFNGNTEQIKKNIAKRIDKKEEEFDISKMDVIFRIVLKKA